MIVIDMLAWWWTRGWAGFVAKLGERLRGTLDYFSFSSLVRTLFAPFKQISVDEGGVALSARIRAWFDRLFSRIMGAVVRLFLMILGIILFVIELVAGAVLIVGWGLVPLVPVACVVLTCLGVAC